MNKDAVKSSRHPFIFNYNSSFYLTILCSVTLCLAIPCLATSTNNNVKVENKSRYCSLFSEIVYTFARFKKASV